MPGVGGACSGLMRWWTTILVGPCSTSGKVVAIIVCARLCTCNAMLRDGGGLLQGVAARMGGIAGGGLASTGPVGRPQHLGHAFVGAALFIKPSGKCVGIAFVGIATSEGVGGCFAGGCFTGRPRKSMQEGHASSSGDGSSVCMMVFASMVSG